jgi:hypothetical protein
MHESHLLLEEKITKPTGMHMQIILYSSVSNPQGNGYNARASAGSRSKAAVLRKAHGTNPLRPGLRMRTPIRTEGNARREEEEEEGGRATYDSVCEVDKNLEESRPPRLFHEQRTKQLAGTARTGKPGVAVAGGRTRRSRRWKWN